MPAVSSRGRGRRTINEINMVPFIDVMLVLLIIFMVTAPLITPSVINLPSVDRANKQPDKPIEIVIKSDDEIQIKKDASSGSGGSSIPMSQIGQAARAAQMQPQHQDRGNRPQRALADNPAGAPAHCAGSADAGAGGTAPVVDSSPTSAIFR